MLSSRRLLISCLKLSYARIEAARLAYLDQTIAAQLRSEARDDYGLYRTRVTLMREERRWQRIIAALGKSSRETSAEKRA